MKDFEERLIRIEEQVDNISDMRKDLQDLTVLVTRNTIATQIGKGILWLLGTAIVAGVIKYFN